MVLTKFLGLFEVADRSVIFSRPLREDRRQIPKDDATFAYAING